MVGIRTLLDLLATLIALVGVAPLWPHLDRPARLLLPLALLVGLACDRRRRYPLTSLPATLVSLVCVAVYAIQISRTTLVEPAVNILALLLAVRLVTEKSGRNYLQIFVLAIFTLAGSTLLSLSIGFFAYLILLVVLVTVGLVLLSFHAVDPDLVLDRPRVKKILGVALLLPTASLPLMVFFFAILPRTEHPLWNFLNPGPTGASGFSDQVQPGRFAATAATQDVAFRVGGESLDPEQLYWRTIVLNAMDGAAWVRENPPPGETTRVVGGRRVTLDFFCEPRQGRYLPTLDLPVQIGETPNREVGERVFTTQRRNERRQHYRVTAMVGGSLEQPGRRIDRDFYLRPPTAVSARVAAVARRIAAEAATAEERIARLEAFFRDQRLSYATTDLPGPDDPVDSFLFEKKRGYCEFFASSFAQLSRLSGVPARLVGGYYGGAYNELGGYYLVGEDSAHVWVEALLDDGHWRRIDPSRLADNAASALLGVRANPIGPARRLTDAIDYFWTQAVITYDFSRQFELARAARDRLRGRTPELSIKPLVGILTALGLAILAWRGWRGRGQSREARILRAYLRALRKRHGLEIPAGVGLRELAERLGDPRCRAFADIYGGALYRDRRLSTGELQQLRAIVRELRKDGGAPKGG